MPDNLSTSRHQEQIFSVGSINADFQMRIERRPEISETLFAHDFVRLSGGKSANVAFLADKLGAPARLFARVGNDELAEQALAPLRATGIDLSGVKPVPLHSTGVAMITVPPDGKKSIVMAPNANEAWSDQDATEVARALAEAPHGSVLVANCEIPASIVEHVMDAAREHGMTTILDPSPAQHVSDAMLALTDILVPNHGEAQALTGIDCKDADSARRAAFMLRERGVGIVCIKLPDGGCLALDHERTIHIRPVPVEAVDSTGAGDAFAGALAVAVLERQPFAEAVLFAVAASHCAVTGYGSQPAYPTREQLKIMMKRLRAGNDDER